MAHVEARTRRIGEHVEDEQLGAAGDLVGFCERAGGVRRLEGAIRLPVVLPLHLDGVGEGGVVPEAGFVGGHGAQSYGERTVA